MAKVKAIPDGYHSITPYLIFKSADAAIKFYERAFGAKEIMRLSSPDGGVGHAEIQVGDSHIMMADESPAFGNKGVETFGGSPASFMFYVENADAAFDQAVKGRRYREAAHGRPVLRGSRRHSGRSLWVPVEYWDTQGRSNDARSADPNESDDEADVRAGIARAHSRGPAGYGNTPAFFGRDSSGIQ